MRRQTILPDESLREVLASCPVDIIYKTVVDESGLDPRLITTDTRKQKVIITRHLILYFLSINESRSFADIGNVLGKEHATAISSRTAVENWMVSDHEFKLRVIRIAAKIIRNNSNRKVQLIGKVNGLSRHKAEAKFQVAKDILERDGWDVWNPMENVPTDIERGEEMRICLRSLIDPRTVAVAVHPDWVDSAGSKVEYMVANSLNLQMIML